MTTKKTRYKARFPRGRFNTLSTCKVVEDGYVYLIKYGLVCFIKQHFEGSVIAFIEKFLDDTRHRNPDYANDPEYIRVHSLFPPST